MSTSYHSRTIADATPGELAQLANRKRLAKIDGCPTFDTVSTPCSRCGGAGGWQGWPGFTCFRCGGTRTDPSYFDVIVAEAPGAAWCQAAQAVLESYWRRRDAKEEARMQAARERQQAIDSAIDADALLAAARTLAQLESAPQFVKNVMERCAVHGVDSITEKQRAALEKVFERRAAEAARGELNVDDDGRQVVKGRIASLKEHWSRFGSSMKVLVVLEDGNKVYGTQMQCRTQDADRTKRYAQVGDVVQFEARLERSADDRHFGFFSRPTKGVFIERALETEDESVGW